MATSALDCASGMPRWMRHADRRPDRHRAGHHAAQRSRKLAAPERKARRYRPAGRHHRARDQQPAGSGHQPHLSGQDRSRRPAQCSACWKPPTPNSRASRRSRSRPLAFIATRRRPVDIDLNELLQAVVDLFGRKLAGKRLRMRSGSGPELTIVGLQGEIRQVVSNLLVNAIDASRTRPAAPFGSADVIVIATGTAAFPCMISDQGSGIPHHVRRTAVYAVCDHQAVARHRPRALGDARHGGKARRVRVRFRSRTDAPTGTVFRVYLHKLERRQLFAPQAPAFSSKLASGAPAVNCHAAGAPLSRCGYLGPCDGSVRPPRSGQTMIPYLFFSDTNALKPHRATPDGGADDQAPDTAHPRGG